MNTQRKQHDEKCNMSAPQAQIYRPFQTHEEQALPDKPRPRQYPWWVRVLQKVGAMADTDNQFPRINPAVIGLLTLILISATALGGALLYIGSLSATVSQQVRTIEKLDKKLDDNNIYWESRYSEILLQIDKLKEQSRGKK